MDIKSLKKQETMEQIQGGRRIELEDSECVGEDVINTQRTTTFGGISGAEVIHGGGNKKGQLPIKYKPFRFYEDRLSTFDDWPKFMNPRPSSLARAGFIYTGRSDKVKCFECGVTLCNWEPSDEPISEHIRWSSMCKYINKLINHGGCEYRCCKCGNFKEWGYRCCVLF